MTFKTVSRISVLAAAILFAPDLADEARAAAPDQFKVKFETSGGTIVIEVIRKWSPLGADRFHEAVKAGFFDECRFFRVVPNFIVQFGINGDPKVQKIWKEKTIKDEPVTQSNKRGTLTFAKSNLPNTRTTQLFINSKDNANLDKLGFSPFGRVIEGMKVVDAIFSGYGQRPDQRLIQSKGNAYLKTNFPKLDYIKKATIVKAKP
ncbi:MAG: peptidylprolyl isomerase [Planctomycetes bacterium]|nr:peptidylprolyl isomerase [Planctomycetota bacterium]